MKDELKGTFDNLELEVQPGQWRVILRPENKQFSLSNLKNVSGGDIVLVCTDEHGEFARVDTQEKLEAAESRESFPAKPLPGGARFVLALCEYAPVTLRCEKAHFGG